MLNKMLRKILVLLINILFFSSIFSYEIQKENEHTYKIDTCLKDIDICIIKQEGEYSPSAEIQVKKKNIIVDKLFFSEGELEGLGGYSGIFFPNIQPLQHYFILMKFGGYDVRLLLISKEGKIFNFAADEFYVYKNFLISFRVNEVELNEVTIFDMIKENSITLEHSTVINYFSCMAMYDFYLFKKYIVGVPVKEKYEEYKNNFKVLDKSNILIDVEARSLKKLDDKFYMKLVKKFQKYDSENIRWQKIWEASNQALQRPVLPVTPLAEQAARQATGR